MHRGQIGFQRHDPIGGLVGAGDAGQVQELGQVADVGGADLGVLLLAVVGLVG